jgi:hypothetical protein
MDLFSAHIVERVSILGADYELYIDCKFSVFFEPEEKQEMYHPHIPEYISVDEYEEVKVTMVRPAVENFEIVGDENIIDLCDLCMCQLIQNHIDANFDEIKEQLFDI